MSELFVIKFGGSAITKKSSNEFEMNYFVVRNAVREIFSVLEKKNFEVIVVCGVGPFGHTNVVKYDLNNGVKTIKQKKGVRITNKACDFVGKEVVKEFNAIGLKAKLIPAYKVCVQKNKNVFSFNFEPYEKALKNGFIPITTGAMVVDLELGWSVMSGDEVIAQLAKFFAPKKILMGTDVDGIFTADPKLNKKAKIIKEVNSKNFEKILEKTTKANTIDVTGGMRGKFEKLIRTLNGNEGIIFNLKKKNQLKLLLEGKKVICTRILL